MEHELNTATRTFVRLEELQLTTGTAVVSSDQSHRYTSTEFVLESVPLCDIEFWTSTIFFTAVHMPAASSSK